MAYPSLATLIVLSASAASAFVQFAPTPQRTAPLHATEAFQRSLLAARLAATAPPDTSSAAVDDDKKQEKEEFQRSLLEAKLANDVIDAALAATPTAEPEPAPAAEEGAPAAAAEPEPEPEPEPAAPEPVVEAAAPEPEPEPAAAEEETPVAVAEPEPVPVPEPEPEPAAPEPVVAAAAPEPEREAPKPYIPAEVPRPPRVVKPTEFTVPRELAIVPVNEATVQFTAGTVGAAAGFLLGGGPVGAALGAISFNYLSRKDEDKASTMSAKKVVDTASQTALYAYNYLAQVEKENGILDSILSLLEKVVDKAKESDSPAGDALVAVESTLGGIAGKVEELNDDYDLVGGAGTVLDSVGELVEMGVDKVVDLNEEYKLTERAGSVVKGAVKTVTEK